MREDRRNKRIFFIGLLITMILAVTVIYSSRKTVEVVNVSSTVYLTEDKYVPDEEKININTANEEELQRLEGIGEKLSEKIIEYREANGDFASAYELAEVNGISEEKAEKLAPYVKVE